MLRIGVSAAVIFLLAALAACSDDDDELETGRLRDWTVTFVPEADSMPFRSSFAVAELHTRAYCGSIPDFTLHFAEKNGLTLNVSFNGLVPTGRRTYLLREHVEEGGWVSYEMETGHEDSEPGAPVPNALTLRLGQNQSAHLRLVPYSTRSCVVEACPGGDCSNDPFCTGEEAPKPVLSAAGIRFTRVPSASDPSFEGAIDVRLGDGRRLAGRTSGTARVSAACEQPLDGR